MMTNLEKYFHKIVLEIPNAVEGKMFGAMSIKTNNGKNAAFFWHENMVFKLDEKSQKEALNLEGAEIGSHIYAPERKMKGWILIPNNHADQWARYANKAVEFVSSL